MSNEIKFGIAGAIYSERAYALGKMLDHSSWYGTLTRKITPSDVDMLFDNAGKIMLCELSSAVSSWSEVQIGQRWLYQSFIKDQPHCAVLCRHNVDPSSGRQINTRFDIQSFQVMVWEHEQVLSRVYDGNHYWQRVVELWVNHQDGPAKIRRSVLGYSVGLVRPPKTNVIPISTVKDKNTL